MLEIEELKSVIEILKRLLKERGISYREVGVRLGLSESGVKKVFASEDVSYVRLAQIADILGLKILDLLAEIQETTFENVRFTVQQQEQFLKDPQLFAVFYKLVIERLSVTQMSQQLMLNEIKTFSYLRRLDELQLIELYEGSKIKLPPLRMVRNFGDGPFLSKI